MLARAYLLGVWETADHMLKVAKALESRVRDDLTADLLKDEKPDAYGTFNFYIDDKEITVHVSQSVTIDKADYDMNKEDLTDPELDAIEFVPKLDKKKYDNLPKDCTLRRECAVVKTGKPTVKVLS